MTNNMLQSVNIPLEKEREEQCINNVANVIIAKIIMVAYSQSNKSTKKGITYNNELLKSTGDIVMDKKLSIKIDMLSHYQSSGMPICSNLDRYVAQLYTRHDFKPVVQKIISKVNQSFPEMKIVVDPLETYILFDWS